MKQTIDQILQQLEAFRPGTLAQVEEFRVHMLGKKGMLTRLFEDFKHVDPAQKRELGQLLNQLKTRVQDVVKTHRTQLEQMQQGVEQADDLTKPAHFMSPGSRHPIALVLREILDIYAGMGFSIAEGPEIEDDRHVFSALNFPPDHPARDMQDTFSYIQQPTIPFYYVRIPVLCRCVPWNTNRPFELYVGKGFQERAISARAHCIFHQVEGLYIDEKVSFADLKQAILLFVRRMFGSEARIRLRPSFFPFTEPSAEVDVSCNICNGEGCNVCKNTGWLEIMGAGMVDPNVLEASGIDAEKYSGYAFGMGVERIAMLKWQIKDLRLYFENDVKFLEQFFLW